MDKITAKEIFVPPLALTGLWLLFCICGFIATGELQTMDGRPDNAPRAGSLILGLFSPFVFLVLTTFNFMDVVFVSISSRSPWMGTVAAVIGLGTLVSVAFYSPENASSPMIATISGITLAFFLIVPVSLVRRFVCRKL